jgi:hypothetical protein
VAATTVGAVTTVGAALLQLDPSTRAMTSHHLSVARKPAPAPDLGSLVVVAVNGAQKNL